MGNSASENSSSSSSSATVWSDEDDGDDRNIADETRTTIVKPSDDEEDLFTASEACSATTYIDESHRWHAPDMDCLYKADKIYSTINSLSNKERINLVAKQQHALLQYFENRYSRGETSIGKAQFCETVSNWGLSANNSQRVFALFDTDGREQVDISSSMASLKAGQIDLPSMVPRGLPFAVQLFQRCTLTPGFADFHCIDVDVDQNFERNIEQFLDQAKLRCDHTPLVPEFSLDAVYRMRIYILKRWLNCERFHTYLANSTITNDADMANSTSGESKSEWPRPSARPASTSPATRRDVELAEQNILKRCYRSIDVSSNKSDSWKLTDGDPGTYWQSDGPHGSHHIDIALKSAVVVVKLNIWLSSSDRNFMPKFINVSTGRSLDDLHSLLHSPIEVPNDFQGRFKLLHDCRQLEQCIRISIVRCHGDGCDTRVRGLEIEGYRKASDQETAAASPDEAAVLWYLNILTSTVEACLPVAPSLQRMIIDHTNVFVRHLPPLSLTGYHTPNDAGSAPKRKSKLLTPVVLDAAERSLERIVATAVDEKTVNEGVKILCMMAIARINVNSVLRVFRHYANMKTKVSDELARELKDILENTMTSLFLCHATKLPCGGVSSSSRSIGQCSLMGPFTSQADSAVLNIAMKPPIGCSMMMPTRMTVKLPYSSDAVYSGVIYAVADERALDDLMENSKLEFPTETNSESVKIVGRFTWNLKEKSNTEVDVYLDPCHCPFVFIRVQNSAESGNASGVSLEKISLYGFAASHDHPCKPKITGASRILPMLWNELGNETNPNLQLACRLMLFTNMVASLAYDFDVGGLAHGRSSQQKSFDMDLLDSCFELIRDNSSWTTKLAFLQFISDVFRHCASCEVSFSECTSSRRIWDSLVALSSTKEDESTPPQAIHSAVTIISNGIKIFYPTLAERRSALFSLLTDCRKLRDDPVSEITFASLCECFSGPDAAQLLPLAFESTMDNAIDQHESGRTKMRQELLDVMEKLYEGYSSCLIGDLKNGVKNGNGVSEQSTSVGVGAVLNTQLLQLFAWYKHQTKNASELMGKENIDAFHKFMDELVTRVIVLTTRYLRKVFEHILKEVNHEDMCSLLSGASSNLGCAFISTYQLALAALDRSSMADFGDLLREVSQFIQDARLTKLISKAIWETAEEKKKELECGGKQLTTLTRWTNVESTHPYSGPFHVERIFHQPGAVLFEIEFSHRFNIDPNDQMFFISDDGWKTTVTKRTTGNKKWPTMITVPSKNRLQFIFKSDFRSTAAKLFGYKFTVTAKGIPVPTVKSWLPDLFFTLAQFAGQLFTIEMSRFNVGTTKAMELAKETLRQFRSVDESDRPGASLFCLTFLRPSLDFMAENVMRGDVGDELGGIEFSRLAIDYWSEVVSCSAVFHKDADRRNYWLLHVFHLFPWCHLTDSSAMSQSDRTNIGQIIRLIFSTALRQQDHLRRKSVELKDEIINAQVYGTFRDWLAILRPGGSYQSGSISKAQFEIWRKAKYSTADMDEKRLAKLFVSQYADILKCRIICDSCDRTLDGIRYHCMVCVDMDLCASCLSMGHWPVTHSSDHAMMAFSFKCNNCNGYIIGSRFHCTVCKDYDLCFGCMLNSSSSGGDGGEDEEERSKVSGGHKRDHPHVAFPRTVLREDHSYEQLMNQYLSQFSWLMATKLACALARMKRKSSTELSSIFTDILIDVAKKQFFTISAVSEERGAHCTDGWIWVARASYAEQENSERLLGLLALNCFLGGANTEQMQDALVLAYKILKSEQNDGRPYSGQLALGLLGKLCLIGGPDASDRALNECSRNPVTGCRAGHLTSQFLYFYGLTCLASAELQWASAVATIYQRLMENTNWTAISCDFLCAPRAMDEELQPTWLGLVYNYSILSGMPALLRRGAPVEYADERGITQRGMVVEIVEKGLIKVMNSNGRRFKLINANDVWLGVDWTPTVISGERLNLEDVVTDTEIHVTGIVNDDQWSKINYELLWVAALSIKTLSAILERKKDDETHYPNGLFSTEFCCDLMCLASHSTALPMGTKIDTLEILMMNLVATPAPNNTGTVRKSDGDGEENDDGENGGDAAAGFLHNLPDNVRDRMRTWHREFNVPLSLLRAIYDAKRGDTASLLQEVRRLFFPRAVTPVSQDLAFRAACLERAAILKNSNRTRWEYNSVHCDFGFSAMPLVSDRLDETSRINLALMDEEEISDEFITNQSYDWTTGATVEEDNEQRGEKEKANETFAVALLLREELEKEGGTVEHLRRQVGSALVVVYARKLLSELLARWPDSVPFNEEKFGLQNYWQLLNLVDMLKLTPECVSNTPRALAVVFHRCPKLMIRPLTYASCQLLQEGSEEVVRKNFSEQTKEDFTIPRAASVRIVAPLGFGEGEFALDFDDPRRGHQKMLVHTRPVDIIVNTNKFRISFVPRKLGLFTGEKLMVKIIGKNFRYFNTGYEMLRLLLDGVGKEEWMGEHVPISHLWVWLLYVCCRTTGRQRLRLIHLLIRLVSVLDTGKLADSKSGLIEFRLAAPLWKLLNDLNGISANGRQNYLPETGRRLAQFFFVLERLAMKWNLAGTLSLAMSDCRPAVRSYAHGCRIIANICAEVGVENEMTILLQTMAMAAAGKGIAKDEDKEKTKVTATTTTTTTATTRENWNNTTFASAQSFLDSEDGSLSDLASTDENTEDDDDDSEYMGNHWE